jgi:hypothetical protein
MLRGKPGRLGKSQPPLVGKNIMPQYPGFDIATFTAHFKRITSSETWSFATYWKTDSQNLTEANIVTACNQYKSQLANVIGAVMHETCAMTRVNCRVFAQGKVIDGEDDQAAVVGDVSSGDVLPISAVLVIQRKTTSFGRSARGRIFLSGIAEEINNGGFVNVTYNTVCRGLAAFFGADRTFAIPFHARHWDRKNNTFVPISKCTCLDKISTLRSRTRKVRGAAV